MTQTTFCRDCHGWVTLAEGHVACRPKCKCDPQPNRLDPVVEAVRADLHRRSQFGIAKYGTTLGENPAAHRAKLQHAYEEALDFCNYVKWAMMEIDKQDGTAPVYMYGLHSDAS